MQYAQSAYNPHAAPAPLTMASLDPTGHRPQVRIFFLIAAAFSGLLYISGIVALVVGIVANPARLDLALLIAGYATVLLGALLVYVKLGLALYWLHGAWKWVPIEQRAGRDGKRYTPDGVFMLLIPYYHFYWQFPINLGLCDAMERLRQATNGTQAPKRDTAMWAAICELIPFANFFVAPFLWASYMRSIDVMHDEIATALTRYS